MNLGSTQYLLGNFEQANAHLRRALKIEPAHALASLSLVHSLAQLGKWHVAFEELRRFLSSKAQNRNEHLEFLIELGAGIENFGTSEKAMIKRLSDDFF